MATQPVAIVCVGMAGSGKTTFMQRINSHLHSRHTPPYVMNLDPAVSRVPFACNIDIRDSINYKEVMSQYRLGPNGGILTSLNLFATKVDQIISLLEKRTSPPSPPSSETATTANEAGGRTKKPISHILIDTPGQIEVFVWSASGSILLDALASSFPTVIAYVIDTPRTSSTSTFMSNMLYACSILYKTKLPMILVFNKTDVRDAAFAREWMVDFESFQEALRREEVGGDGGEGGGGGSGYMGSLLNSMSLMLEEFYRHLSVVGVSAVTGQGVEEFFEAVEAKRAEFERDYRPELERRRNEREKEKVVRREGELGRLMQDMNVSASSSAGASANGMRRARAAAGTKTAGRMGKGKGKGKGRGKREPETISDIEDSSSDNGNLNHGDNDDDADEDDDEEEEEETPAQLVDPDSSDQDNDHGADNDHKRGENADGLTQRYQRALADESGGGGGGGGNEGEETGRGKREEKEELARLARYLKAGGV